MKNKEQQKGRTLSVEIRDVESGELLKEGLTKGIACVYKTKEETNCFLEIERGRTIDVVGILFGLQKLIGKIEDELIKQTSVATVEKIKALIKIENSEISGKEGE